MLSNRIAPLLLALITAGVGPCGAQAQSNCQSFARLVLQDPSNKAVTANITEFLNDPSCFIEASEAQQDADEVIRPAINNVWNAVTSMGGAQQQGASTSAGATTNAVTKPSGPTALIEEFGGVNVTPGASSTTYQLSPGTLLKNLALTGVKEFCMAKDPNPELHRGCISASEAAAWSQLTFKVTANTSSGGQSMNGTATNSSSPSTSQPVTVNSKGASGPSFNGLTAQYSFLNSKSKASTQAAPPSGAAGAKQNKTPGASTITSTAINYYQTELKKLVDAQGMLDQCSEHTSWAAQVESEPYLTGIEKGSAVSNPSDADVEALANFLITKYQSLQSMLRSSKDVATQASVKVKCSDFIETDFSALYAAFLEARAYEAFSIEDKPEAAIEYDLNTPQNKPAYSSVKLTLSKSFGKPGAPTSGPAVKGQSLSKAQVATNQWAMDTAKVLAKTTVAGNQDSGGNAQGAGTTAGADPSPWTFTANGTVDIYNEAPPNGVPSASHLRDIQAGAEIAYVWSPPNGTLRAILGNVNAAAAYSYQDQTSPAILTGPALSDFTGLPSSTTSAYAKRGIIHLGQIRLGIGDVGNKNVSLPLAFTYSNRSELIVHPVWGVQFGVSYNFSSLLGGSSSKQTSSGSASQQ